MASRGLSIIVIGGGIFSFWILLFANGFVAAEKGYEDFPTFYEMYRAITDMQTVVGLESVDIEALTGLFLLILGILGAAIGIIVIFAGGLVMLYEKLRKRDLFSVRNKTVSPVWQIICVFIPGFDWWAFYRIKKLRLGLAIWGISYLTTLGEIYEIIPASSIPFVFQALFALVYAYFVYRWSKDWNNKIKSVAISEEDHFGIFT